MNRNDILRNEQSIQRHKGTRRRKNGGLIKLGQTGVEEKVLILFACFVLALSTIMHGRQGGEQKGGDKEERRVKKT